MHRVTVPLGARSYDVLVGAGARHALEEVLPAGARRLAVVTQDGSKGGAAVAWIVGLVGIGGLAWFAYTVFTSK